MIKDYIQIAGVIDGNEASLLIDCGVKFIGFPIKHSVNKEDLSEKLVANIIQSFPTSVHGVLITYLSDAIEISELCKFLGINIVQIRGDIEESELSKLSRVVPNLLIIKSLIVKDDNLSELKKTMNLMSPYVDAFITDTFDPNTGAIGATGQTHDWEMSGSLVQVSNKPVILAGGLTPLNVYEGILKVRPSGVDVHTGVELKNGRKSSKLVKEFVLESKRAFEQIRSI